MAVVSKEDLLKQIKDFLGDNTSDEALKLIEDASDTLDANSSGADIDALNKQIETLKTEKEELDKAWRDKYRDRFFSADPKGSKDNPEEDESREEEDEVEEPTEFSELFSTEE